MCSIFFSIQIFISLYLLFTLLRSWFFVFLCSVLFVRSLFCSHIIRTTFKSKNIVLEKTFFQRFFMLLLTLLKPFHLRRKKREATKIKSSTENLTSMIYVSFSLGLYFETFHFGVSIAQLLWR